MQRICGAFVGLILLMAPAAASDGKQLGAQAMEAAHALKQQAAETAAAGKRLDLKHGRAAELYGRIFNTKGFDKLPPSRVSDLPWMLDWVDAVRDANYTMLYFGANPKTPLTLDPAGMERNVREYEDEITRATVFSQKLFPRLVETGIAFWESLPEKERTPIRMEGIAKMLDGYAEAVTGALGFAAGESTRPENARSVLAALHETVETWATLSPPDARKTLSAMLKAAHKTVKDKEAAKHLLAIQAAFDATKS